MCVTTNYTPLRRTVNKRTNGYRFSYRFTDNLDIIIYRFTEIVKASLGGL